MEQSWKIERVKTCILFYTPSCRATCTSFSRVSTFSLRKRDKSLTSWSSAPLDNLHCSHLHQKTCRSSFSIIMRQYRKWFIINFTTREVKVASFHGSWELIPFIIIQVKNITVLLVHMLFYTNDSSCMSEDSLESHSLYESHVRERGSILYVLALL